MDLSEEITDDVPCFIVPDSQASQSGSQISTNTVSLKGLTTCIQPSINLISDKNMGDSNNSDSTVFPNSSSSEARSNDSSLSSSKGDSNSESGEKTTKEDSLYLLRSERTLNNIVSRRNASTPVIQSIIFPDCHTVENLTPVEHASVTSISTQEECKVKDTSSSDDFISPSLELKKNPSEEEQDNYEPVLEQTANQDVALVNQGRTQDGLCFEPKEKDQTDAFHCLQMSGESNHEGDLVNVPLSASELLGPESPGEVVQEERTVDVQKICDDQQSRSNMMADINNEITACSLPLWQQQMTRPDKTLSVNGSLTKTLSDASTVSSRTTTTEKSFPHPWQSPENDSDCDMFEKDTDSLPKNNNLQSSSSQQPSSLKGPSPPELSQDIFQHKLKDVAGKSVEGEQISSGKPESSSTGDVTLGSQDDVFCLHLTQSQSSTTASQARSQPSRLLSSHNLETQRTRDKEEDVIDPTSPVVVEENAVNDTTPAAVDDGNAVNNVTPPCVILGGTIIKQTPIGQPSSTGHQEVISNKTTAGEIINISSDSSHLTKDDVSEPNALTESTSEDLPDRDVIQGKTDGKINESTESVESGLVGFHFSPPAMFLKPVPRNSPPRLETGSESSQDLDRTSEIASTSEFRPVSRDLITRSTKPTVPTLSFSVPVLCEENTDDHVFNLRKDVLDEEAIVTLPTSSERSVFTNIRERFQPAKTSSPDDSVDPFEFRDEVYSPQLPMRKRKSRNVIMSSAKKRKSDTSGISRSNLDQVGESDGTRRRESNLNSEGQPARKKRLWKVSKTTVITKTTTLIETWREIIFTEQDGTVIKTGTDHNISDPTCRETTDVKHETQEEVDKIPQQITFSSLRNSEEPSCVETDKSKSSNETGSTVQRYSKISCVQGSSCDISEGNIILDKECDKETSSVARPTNDEDITTVDTGESSKSDLCKSSATRSTISPPFFPPLSNRGSLTSLDARFAASVPSSEESLVTKTTAKGEKSFSGRYEKRKRSISSDNPTTSRRSSTSPRILRVLREGTRVFALWYDKHYYPGHVVSKCNINAKYRIKFDDGDESDIREQCVFVIDYLPRDQPVMFCEKPGGMYVDGVIQGFYKDGDDKGYKVLGKNKNVVRCPRSNVMLRAEQAAIYLSLRGCITEPSVSPNSVNRSSPLNGHEPLEAAVRITKMSNKSTSKLRLGHEDTSSGPLTERGTNTKGKSHGKRKEKSVVKNLPQKDSIIKKRCRGDENVSATNVLSEEESVTKKPKEDKVTLNKKCTTNKGKETDAKHQNSSSSETPKSRHKSSKKKSSTKNISGSKNSDANVRNVRVRRCLSPAMKGFPERSHPIPTRKSPRKHNHRVVNNENLILPVNKDLFRGYGFILTGSDLISVPDENSPREEEQVVYIRNDVIRQIKTGGGEVLDRFLKDSPQDSCFLLSNVCRTTAKFFNALVLGIPCVSHAWVRDCCLENRLIDFKSYLLPAGKNLITEHLVEAQNYRDMDALRGLKVHLVGDDGFKQHWTEVLDAAGCEIIQKLPTNILQKLQHEDQEYVCDVIVVGNGHVAHSTIQKARLLSIATVTIHWVKQCILTGQRVDFNAHQSFIYRV